VVRAYGQFIRQYDRLITLLESEIGQVHGPRLGPSLIMFHVQLIWHNWLVVQPYAAQTHWVESPEFGMGLSILEAQNNLMRPPIVTNIPLLLSLRTTPSDTVVATPAPRSAPI
jgi:hypothetical protein